MSTAAGRVPDVSITIPVFNEEEVIGEVLWELKEFLSRHALAFCWAKDQTRLWPWVLTGVWLGLGVLAKYTAAFELLSFGCFCAWHAPSRRHLRGGGLLIMLLTVALFLVPVVAWNFAHGWLTSRFLAHRGDLDQRIGLHPLNVVTFLGGQAAVISPLLFVAVLIAALRPRASGASTVSKGPTTAYLLSRFWPLFGFYLLLSVQQTSQANWPAAAYVGGLILVARLACPGCPRQAGSNLFVKQTGP